MAADLVRSRVDVILAITTPAAVAAKAATTTLPIVFEVGADPVKLGLVAGLSKPGGNLTGVSLLNVELGAKRLELLRGVVPTTTIFGLLINPKNSNAETISKECRRRRKNSEYKFTFSARKLKRTSNRRLQACESLALAPS
jgi:ABC-type uncharacterized transport system substrate-binding protein